MSRDDREKFEETFHDAGKTDMVACMRAYRDIASTASCGPTTCRRWRATATTRPATRHRASLRHRLSSRGFGKRVWGGSSRLAHALRVRRRVAVVQDVLPAPVSFSSRSSMVKNAAASTERASDGADHHEDAKGRGEGYPNGLKHTRLLRGRKPIRNRCLYQVAGIGRQMRLRIRRQGPDVGIVHQQLAEPGNGEPAQGHRRRAPGRRATRCD